MQIKNTCLKPWFLLLLLTGSFSVLAQPNTFFVAQEISVREGLSSPNVRKIAQDNYGFYWIATQDGLNRYDGNRFYHFNSGLGDAKTTLLGTDVYSVDADHKRGLVYAITAYGGLNVISTKENRVVQSVFYKNPQYSSTLWFYTMAATSSHLFIACRKGELARYNKQTGQMEQYADVRSLKGGAAGHDSADIDHIAVDGNGLVWIFIGKMGILITDTAFREKHFLSLNQIGLKVKDKGLSYFKHASIWGRNMILATREGLKAVSTDNFLPIKADMALPAIPAELLSNEIKCMNINNKTLILLTAEFLYHCENGNWEKQLLAPGGKAKNWFENSFSLFFNSDIVAIGSQDGLLWSNRKSKPFIPYTISQTDDRISIPHSTTLYKENDSILFVCDARSLYRLNTFTGSIKNINSADFYFTVFPVSPKYLLVSGSAKGSWLIDYAGKMTRPSALYPKLALLEDDLLVSCAPYNDSLILMASQNGKGIYLWNRKRKTIRVINGNTAPVALPSAEVNRLYVDGRNKIWIISDNDISVYDHEQQKITPVPVNRPGTLVPVRINMDITETREHYWIASYGTGIIQLDKNYKLVKIYSGSEGLQSLSLYKIHSVGDSIILASSNNGLSVLNIKKGRAVSYFSADGLMSDNFEETSGAVYKDEIYFGGINGITKVNPGKFYYTPPTLSLYFTQVEIVKQNVKTDTFNLESHRYNIPAGFARVSVHFTAIGAIYPQKLDFQYRIVELSKEWSSNGKMRFVDFIGTKPGTYHLEVRVMDENGHISPTKTLTLRFLPKWHQTLGFKMLVGLVAFGLIYAFYRYRLNQIRKQQKIRKDIASDLHDDIGSTLNSVKVYTHLALEGKDKEQYIQMARQNLEQASIGLRDMIWVLDDKLDTADELLTRVKQFAIPLANALNIQTDFKCDFDIRDKLLSKEEKRNLLLICKEAVNNSIKYSHATLISVHFLHNNKKLEIRLSDNGSGFELLSVSAGNGLKNIQYRSKQIGYTCTIESAPGSGTHIAILPVK